MFAGWVPTFAGSQFLLGLNFFWIPTILSGWVPFTLVSLLTLLLSTLFVLWNRSSRFCSQFHAHLTHLVQAAG